MILEIILTILGVIIITGVTIIAIKLNLATAKIEVTPNQPLCENPCRRQFTNGYYLGILKTQLPRKNGCSLIEFYPIDAEQGENIPKPQIQGMVVKDEFIKRIPRGSLSSRREIIKFIGRNPTDYPEEMQGTDEGKWLTKEGQLAFIEARFGEGIKAGDEALAEAMTHYARGQIPKAIFQQMEEIGKKAREMNAMSQSPEEKTEKK